MSTIGPSRHQRYGFRGRSRVLREALAPSASRSSRRSAGEMTGGQYEGAGFGRTVARLRTPAATKKAAGNPRARW